MITEDSLSDKPGKETPAEFLNENTSGTETEVTTDKASEENSAPKEADFSGTAIAATEGLTEENTDLTPENSSEETSFSEDCNTSEKLENLPIEGEISAQDGPESAADAKTDLAEIMANEPEITAEVQEKAKEPEDKMSFTKLSLTEILAEMESITKMDDGAAHYRRFNQLKEEANHRIQEENNNLKKDFVAEGNPEELFTVQHPAQGKLSAILHSFREKTEQYHQQQEQSQSANLEHRQNIIDKLKNLYTNTEAGTNLFKAIREIKDEWKNAGQVAKSEFKLLNNNYFHHLNQFYQMLDMNKEYMEQEFAHNLEKRTHIIERAKELLTEPSVQKALNELQYLHKLWKEEAEPVAEEFREKTWDEFKELSNKIHDRKAELTELLEKELNENLARKNEIIEELKKLVTPGKEVNHSYWQNAINKVEELRTEFLRLGNVPRKFSNQNWNDFKQNLRNFNVSKNEFYKGLKNSQQTNLDEKLKLIQTAKDNMLSEDWETAVPLYKKLQDDWKKIGHVPRSMTNKVWDDFREACNVFFSNYREKNNTAGDNWKENFKNKKQLLEELKAIGNEEGSIEKIEQIKNSWNSIGKVPREKININTEFNKTLREKLKLNQIHDYDLKEEGLSENQLTDKARKIKNQIADLEAEVVKMENNLGFFSNSSRENPLLKDTYARIEEKKAQIETMKKSLHNIVAGENS
ncbi:DUF349 domain-containing protein [Chryseobacterium sp. H3056]|uniref:DUF349 domain-containing protein n=2 Tax=Kaistella daneshvariae TaxID=2487074 RepID=A0A3N0WXW4_9FLAO|nr:DUF349 domain-containing protein [Kaistella daneshvariae]ROI09944.1 DUF349 domain-containing protein [Kaistella daneshvariae]